MRTHMKTDWLKMERRLREALQKWHDYDTAVNSACAVPDDDHPAVVILHEISDIIGEETGRGFPLE